MVKFVILRGPTAAGKSTLANEIILELKSKGISAALIEEDHFRKKIQRKYKADDSEVHHNSVDLITTLIPKLLEIDNYEIVILEGLLRYEEMLKRYKDFCKKQNYKMMLFQCDASLEVRKGRNSLSETRDHVVDMKKQEENNHPEEIPFRGSIILDMSKSIKENSEKVLEKILA